MSLSDDGKHRRIRLAVLGLAHETNTFSPVPADAALLAASGILRGAEIVDAHRTAHSTIAGFLEAGTTGDVEVVPLLYTFVTPSGPLTTEAFRETVSEMLELLRRGGPWDGVLLAQHGAAVAEGYLDADAEIVRRIRAVVGATVPIGVAIDLHANLSPAMVDAATVVVAYRTNPHLDAKERGRECAELIARTARGEINPVMSLETLPAVISILRQGTSDEPMRTVMADLATTLQWPGILTASITEGYPYADVPAMGMAVLAVADRDPMVARRAARWLASRTWRRRIAFTGRAQTMTVALTEALDDRQLEPTAGPIVLLDVGDNIGAGAPGDSTFLFAEACRLGAENLLVILRDPEAVAVCGVAGEGATIELTVGAKTDSRHGLPVTIRGVVRALSGGRFEEPAPVHGGFRFFDAGATAVIETAGDRTIVLTSHRVMPTSLAQLRVLGIEPTTKRIIIAKGVVSPLAAYGPIASRVVAVDTPGVTSGDLGSFRYRRRRRPLFPFERDASYPIRRTRIQRVDAKAPML